jgi:enolase
MVKIKKGAIYKIYNGDGWPALGLKLWLSNERTVWASASLLAADFTKAELDELFSLSQQKFSASVLPFLLDLELGADTALTTDNWLKNWPSEERALPALSLVVSVLANRVAAVAANQELYQYFNLTYGFKEEIFTLPTPLFNVFNGGRHADTNLDFEEFLLVPLSKNQTSFSQKLEAGSLVWHALADQLRQAGFDTDLGSFGGFAPEMTSSLEAIELIEAACQAAGFAWGKDFGLGLDIGAAYLSSGKGNYLFKLDSSRLASASLVNLYEEWQSHYQLVYVEDPVAPADLGGWKRLAAADNSKLILAGDKFFANSANKFRQNLKDHLANAIVITPSSFATISEAVSLIKLAQEHNYQIVLSDGDQETIDSWLADLAVAAGVEWFKSGALARGERNSKLNRLIEIEQDVSM